MRRLKIKDYAELNKISIPTVYKRINKGFIKKIKEGRNVFIEFDEEEKETLSSNNKEKFEIENIYLKKEIDKQILLIEELKKEKEDLKYQIKDKDFKINQLLEKLENLNDRVIGLIEWKNKSWWQRILKKGR